MREREVKMVVDGAFELPDLTDAIEGATLGPVRERVTEDVYYDTPDLRLARWMCTLRHRSGAGWTVKLPRPSSGIVLDRSEIDFRGEGEDPPVRALNLISALTRGTRVVEVARLRSRRLTQVWTTTATDRLAELTDDDVSGSVPGSDDVRFREIEVELAEDADDRILKEIVKRLKAAAPSHEQPLPKAIRVLGSAASQPPDVVVVPLPSKPTGRQVIQAALASSVAPLLLHLPTARLGIDPEGVHQARVAARRIYSDLKTFGPLLDRAWSTRLRSELRWLIDALGAVRDCDILAAKLAGVIAQHPEIDRDAAHRVLHQLELQRRQSRRHLLRRIGDDQAMQLFDDLVDAAADPATLRRADRPAREVMPRLVRKHWKRLDRAVQSLARPAEPAELHGVRKLSKRLRYATEAVAPAVGKHARKFAKQAARIQDALGEMNDAAVANAWLRTAADQLDGAAAFAAGQIAQQLVAEVGTQDRAWRSAHRAMTQNTAWFAT